MWRDVFLPKLADLLLRVGFIASPYFFSPAQSPDGKHLGRVWVLFQGYEIKNKLGIDKFDQGDYFYLDCNVRIYLDFLDSFKQATKNDFFAHILRYLSYSMKDETYYNGIPLVPPSCILRTNFGKDNYFTNPDTGHRIYLDKSYLGPNTDVYHTGLFAMDDLVVNDFSSGDKDNFFEGKITIPPGIY